MEYGVPIVLLVKWSLRTQDMIPFLSFAFLYVSGAFPCFNLKDDCHHGPSSLDDRSSRERVRSRSRSRIRDRSYGEDYQHFGKRPRW